MNPLCQLLGIQIPILQAPTASIAGPELASAVSNAGALGSLGLTWTAPDDAVHHVRQTKALTVKPFFVNFALAFEPRGLLPVLEAGAPIVTFSWGDPAPLIPLIREFGAKLGIQVGHLEGARRARDSGADFIICQGTEAGGHVQSTQSLEMWVCDAIKECAPTPVIAAGGLSTGEDIAWYLNLGAQGAMLGTRFVATRESRAHQQYKQLLVQARGDGACLTTCFDGGWPDTTQGVLSNSTLKAWEAAGSPGQGSRPGEGDIVAHSASGEPILRYEDTAPRAGMTGNIEAMALYAGCGVGQITDIPSAEKLVRELWNEANSHISGFPRKPESRTPGLTQLTV